MQPSNSSPIWSSVAVHGTFLTKSVHWLLLSVTNTSFWHTQHSTANIEYVFDILNLSLTSVSHWDYLGNGRRQTHTYDGWLRECRTCSIKWHHYQRPCLIIYKYTPSSTDSSGLADRYKRSNATVMSSAGPEGEWLGEWTNRPKTRGQSNLTKSASRGAHSPVRGHPRGSKFVPLNSWGRVSY